MMTLMENISVKKRGEKPAFTKFFGKDCKVVPFLRRFGEMAVIKEEAKIIGKPHNKGTDAMFVGYAKDHAMGVYRWYCVDQASIRESRDCRFLNMSYAQWKKRDQPKTIQWVDEVEKEQVQVVNMTQLAEEPTLTINNQEGRVHEVVRQGKEPQGMVATPRHETKPPSTNARLIRELSRLGTSYNDEANRLFNEMNEMRQQANTMEEKLDVMEEVGGMAHELFGYDVAFYAALKLEGTPAKENVDDYDGKNLEELMHALDSVLNDTSMTDEMKNEKLRGIVNQLKQYTPTTFQEAYNHPVPIFRERFRKAIRKEFRDMLARGVWRNIKKSDVPNGRRPIKHKWVFDIKRSGR
jgi:hypothetical protein